MLFDSFGESDLIESAIGLEDIDTRVTEEAEVRSIGVSANHGDDLFERKMADLSDARRL